MHKTVCGRPANVPSCVRYGCITHCYSCKWQTSQKALFIWNLFVHFLVNPPTSKIAANASNWKCAAKTQRNVSALGAVKMSRNIWTAGLKRPEETDWTYNAIRRRGAADETLDLALLSVQSLLGLCAGDGGRTWNQTTHSLTSCLTAEPPAHQRPSHTHILPENRGDGTRNAEFICIRHCVAALKVWHRRATLTCIVFASLTHSCSDTEVKRTKTDQIWNGSSHAQQCGQKPQNVRLEANRNFYHLRNRDKKFAFRIRIVLEVLSPLWLLSALVTHRAKKCTFIWQKHTFDGSRWAGWCV